MPVHGGKTLRTAASLTAGLRLAATRITLTWSDGPHAEVTGINVRTGLRTLKITDLKPVR
ncbi:MULTISPECIES: hypothetical protein [Streptomyces]|uniref:hypothetical protein n=1 Tax=Streptomyces TaxID=1883 RepID=UPI0006949CB1|nr:MULTISPECIES: hypothetical protein [Streptomyces]MCH0558561.1 hypothetical protein [Streptomyces sp. MUM 16J]